MPEAELDFPSTFKEVQLESTPYSKLGISLEQCFIKAAFSLMQIITSMMLI